MKAMLALLVTIRDHLTTFARAVTADVVALSMIFLITLGTGVTVAQQALIPALAGFSGYKALMLAIPTFLLPTQGIVLPYVLMQNRPRVRLLFLTALFLAAITSYLIFLGAWWQSLEQYIALLGFLNTPEIRPSPEIAAALRQKFLPHILSALLKDILLSAYLECALWEALRRTRSAETVAQPGGIY